MKRILISGGNGEFAKELQRHKDIKNQNMRLYYNQMI